MGKNNKKAFPYTIYRKAIMGYQEKRLWTRACNRD